MLPVSCKNRSAHHSPYSESPARQEEERERREGEERERERMARHWGRRGRWNGRIARGEGGSSFKSISKYNCFHMLTSACGNHNQRGKTHLFTRTKEYVDDGVPKIDLNTFSQSAGASHSLLCTWPWLAAGGKARLLPETTITTTPCCLLD